jgi:hypothetical protein
MKSPSTISIVVALIIFANAPCTPVLFGQDNPTNKSATDVSSSATTTSPAKPGEIQTINQNREQRAKNRKEEIFNWRLQATLGTYVKTSKNNLKWDAWVSNAMTAYAHLRDDGNYGAKEFQIATNSEAAIDAGCNDPFILYLNTRFHLVHEDLHSQKNFRKYLHLLDPKMGMLTKSYSLAADALNNSDYPPIYKFYGSVRTAISWRDVRDALHDPEVESAYLHLRQTAAENLILSLKDKNMPAAEIFESCDLFLNNFSDDPAELESTYKSIERTLFDNHERYVGLVVRGRFYTDFAWLARGNGTADKVTPDGWEKFSARLDIAEKALTEAWELNHYEPLIPTAMITVEMGQGKGRGRMEMWFLRAMALDPNNSDACDAKCLYLEPKWYGSREKVLSFCRDCLNSSDWGGEVPLTLAREYRTILGESQRHIHEELMSRSTNADSTKPIVLADQPEENFAWSEVKAAFEKYLKNNEADVLERQRYIRSAIRTEQWDTVREQLPLLGGVHYAEILGTESTYKSMLQKAQSATDTSTPSIPPPHIATLFRTPQGLLWGGDGVTLNVTVDDEFVPADAGNHESNRYVKAPNHYQWAFGKNQFSFGRKDMKDILDATNRTYQIASAQPSNSGTYFITVSNAGGTTTESITLMVGDRKYFPKLHEPKIRSDTQLHPVNAKLGDSVEFSTIVITGDANTETNKLGWTWFLNGKEIQAKTGATSTASVYTSGSIQLRYEINAVSADDAGEYSVVATNSLGSAVSSNAMLTIEKP